MPYNLRKKHNPNRRKSHQQLTSDELPADVEPDFGHVANGRRYADTQNPLYDDSNHVAYGWQQMATFSDLPGLLTLVTGMQDDPPLSPHSRPQTWPVEQERVPEMPGQSGFNSRPRRGQGPRRPPPLAESERFGEHSRTYNPSFQPFNDLHPTGPELENAAGGTGHAPPARRALASKDVNQKLQAGRNGDIVSPFQKSTDDLRAIGPRRRSKKLTVDEVEAPRYPNKKIGCMPLLPEEPAPLRVRKKHASMKSPKTLSKSTTFEASVLRTRQEESQSVQPAGETHYGKSESRKRARNWTANPNLGHSREGVNVTVREVAETKDGTMQDLTAAITDLQLSATAGESQREFEHPSAVPKPLNVSAIRAAREKRKLSYSDDVPEVAERRSWSGAKTESVESLTTDSSGFEKLSTPDSCEMEYNRPGSAQKRKWYKGFGRSG